MICAKCGVELVAASGACIDPEEILYIHQLPYFGNFHEAEPTQWEANAAHPVTADRFSRSVAKTDRCAACSRILPLAELLQTPLGYYICLDQEECIAEFSKWNEKECPIL